ncbi:MAG: hypothetical protein L6263_07005, partial [Desulfobacteraceae bacterium]|nr:hypothetical protein [Desulfobacteraceae bacterium]
MGKSIDFLLQFSSCLYTNSERNRWAEHSLIPSFVIRSISSSSDTCVACTEEKRCMPSALSEKRKKNPVPVPVSPKVMSLFSESKRNSILALHPYCEIIHHQGYFLDL